MKSITGLSCIVLRKNILLLNPTRQTVKNPLYVAGQSFSFEQMIRHCLWKVISETGFIYDDQLTEMESIVLSELLKKKYGSADTSINAESQEAMGVLNRAIDKIVCQIKTLQIQSQKYHSAMAENHCLKKAMSNLMKISEQGKNSSLQLKINRSISEIGLSKRTVRLLQSAGIDTLEKLGSCSFSRLRNQDGVGIRTMHEIETALSKYSVSASSDQ